MGFVRNLFAKATEIDRLRDERDTARMYLHRADTRIEVLEKQLQTERDKKDKFMLKYCDQISVQHKLYGVFAKDDTPKPEKPIELSPEEEADVQWLAQTQRNADIDLGKDVPDISVYETAIRQDPKRFMPQ